MSRRKRARSEPETLPDAGHGTNDGGHRRARTFGTLSALALAAVAAGALLWRSLAVSDIRRDRDQSVLLITIDTLRADALGAYGNKAVETPWIDRLAREGARFETAHAHNVVTLPSHANLLSGQYPLAPRGAGQQRLPLSRGPATLATLLEGAGIPHGGLRQRLPPRFPLWPDRRLRRLRRPPRAAARPRSAGPSRCRERAVATRWRRPAAGWTSRAAEDLLLSCTSTSPTSPMSPRSPLPRASASDPYYGEVSAADAALEPLLRPLLEAGPRADARGADLRPWRGPGRPRGADARDLRLRGDPARAPRPLRSRASSPRGVVRHPSATSTSFLPCSTPSASTSPRTCPGAACCP